MTILKFCTCLFASVLFCAVSPLALAQISVKGEKVLIVVSSLDKKTPDLVGGFWFPELTHPVEVFDKAGVSYDIASPESPRV